MVITNYKLFCDRCNKEIAFTHLSWTIKIIKKLRFAKIRYSGYEVEICKDCYESYLKWLKEGGENAEDHKTEA